MFKPIQKLVANRKLKEYQKLVQEINKLEAHYENYSDEALRELTHKWKQQLQLNETTIDQIKIHAFAVVREASKRVLGMRHYDVQLIGGLGLLDGNISEMPTGEGKTLVSSLPSYTRALEGKGVHVITVNEYLAKRDAGQIGKIHTFLGLSVGLNVPDLPLEAKQSAYNADITYGIGTEFGFDYLRDHMASTALEQVQRPYHFAIIDEIDSILVDEAKTPLIIAGKKSAQSHLYLICARFIRTLQKKSDYLFDEESKSVALTEDGITKVERAFSIDNLYDLEHSTLFHYIHNALRAEVLFERDVDYIVHEGEIQLIDLYTGRVMEGRSLSDGLHQAIEAKEGLTSTEENHTVASVTIQNYFRLYPILSGMTGTGKTEEKEFLKVYNMEVIQIPTNRPILRQDREDIIFEKTEQKLAAVLEDVKTRHSKGQPILLGTTSILQSEIIADLLTKEKLSFQLLNAKYVEKEAEMIAQAGQKGMITISTNMAGRGTDILLGEGVAELGGLHVIGTERHDSERIDLQLRGRAGRQGDPGSSQFYLSLEDELFIRYNPEGLEKLKKQLKYDETGRVHSAKIHEFVTTTQRLCEGNQYSAREWSLKLDGVGNEQRRVIYQLRDNLLHHGIELDWIIKQIEDTTKKVLDTYFPEDSIREDWQMLDGKSTLERLIPPLHICEDAMEDREDIVEVVFEAMKVYFELLRGLNEEQLEQLLDSIQVIAVSIIDNHWTEHLDRLHQLNEGIHLRQYQQEDPIRLYEFEGFRLFEQTFGQIQREILSNVSDFFQYIVTPKEEEEHAIID
ncbi:accessory Sec system translocase SecA2 [Bacillus sp. RG28]|uniref:Protein translocase subunit SecA n=1 Tax=Gottfriedia endophytica TaxID=2820819 RepID=A0A940NJ97_9BACI|nr:accessory Sec system translocase SecA2 [Gottfriedia endophytica]MBP0725142.1 accessory Sec system translocase SecA2 [Gottfriedia endophytica]